MSSRKYLSSHIVVHCCTFTYNLLAMSFSLPTIMQFPESKLMGISGSISFANNTTPMLWRSFMPRRNEITDRQNPNELISLQLYPQGFNHSSPDVHSEFSKWAGVLVNSINNMPPGMQVCTIPGGLYAVFHYKGLNTDIAIFQYIFTQWLPTSGYVVDDRPHFEILGPAYKNNDATSEEDIYIPIRLA